MMNFMVMMVQWKDSLKRSSIHTFASLLKWQSWVLLLLCIWAYACCERNELMNYRIVRLYTVARWGGVRFGQRVWG